MRKLIIFYWALQDFEEQTGYKHNAVVEFYEMCEVTKIAESIFNTGLNVMLSHGKDDNVILYVDDRRFQQR